MVVSGDSEKVLPEQLKSSKEDVMDALAKLLAKLNTYKTTIIIFFILFFALMILFKSSFLRLRKYLYSYRPKSIH